MDQCDPQRLAAGQLRSKGVRISSTERPDPSLSSRLAAVVVGRCAPRTQRLGTVIRAKREQCVAGGIGPRERLALIQRVLTEDTMPAGDRMLALLILVYAQPLWKIASLAVDAPQRRR